MFDSLDEAIKKDGRRPYNTDRLMILILSTFMLIGIALSAFTYLRA